MPVTPKQKFVSTRVPSHVHELPRVVIRIGALYVSKTPVVLDTVLGSCISVCMYDLETAIGGMNHFMLPQGVDPANPTSGRYGVHAMELLINKLVKAGAQRGRLRAKVFGGGHVLKIKESLEGVPQQNIDFARAFLKTEKISVVGEDVGGYETRRVLFLPHTGEVSLKRIGGKEAEKMQSEEVDFLQKLEKGDVPGGHDPTLF